MNTQHPHHQALDADEQELARIVRALPGGGPPPALDARILKAAQDAVAVAPRRRRRPWTALGSAWGVSSAAAAVLALGVGWQLLNLPRSTLPANDGVPAPMAVQAEKQHRTEVDFIEPEPLPMTPPPPPIESVASVAAPLRRQQLPPAPVPETRHDAAAEPFMDEHVPAMASAKMADAAIAQAAGAAEQDRRNRSERLESFNAMGAMAKAAAPAPPPPASTARGFNEQASHDSATLDGVIVSPEVAAAAPVAAPGRANTDDTAAARERVAADTTLSRQAWLDRIRQRVRDNDDAGARASLALYLEKYPDAGKALPRDLRRLLKQ